MFLVAAEYGETIKRHLIDKIQKGVFYLVQVFVVIQVFLVEGSHHGYGRRELQECTVAFIGFGHQELAVAQAGIAAQMVYLPSDDDRWVQPPR